MEGKFNVVISDDSGNIFAELKSSLGYELCVDFIRWCWETDQVQELKAERAELDLMILSCSTGRFVSYSV